MEKFPHRHNVYNPASFIIGEIVHLLVCVNSRWTEGMYNERPRRGTIARLMSFLSTHAYRRGIQHTIFRWRRTCALTIPRSKCTLMDCIKQRDGREGFVRGGGGGGEPRGREGELTTGAGHFQRDAQETRS